MCADCPKAKFTGANCENARFNGADCGEASFNGANLIGSCFDWVKFREASFINACLKDVDLTYADFSDCDISGDSFEGVDLSGIKIDLYNPSLPRVKASETMAKYILYCGLRMMENAGMDTSGMDKVKDVANECTQVCEDGYKRLEKDKVGESITCRCGSPKKIVITLE